MSFFIDPPGDGAPMLPPDTFSGRVALVTGGGTGIGLGIALEFARLGAAVLVASRSGENRLKGVQAIEAIGGRAAEIPLDVRDPEMVARAFAVGAERLGPVDILVNNAAANFFAPAEAISLNGWSAVVDRVLTGAFLCSAEFGRRRIAEGGGGAIVSIASTAGLQGGPGVAHSGAAKAGLINLTKSLAAEWGHHGLRANAIAPGTVPHGDDDEKVRQGRLAFGGEAHRRVPLGRVGTLREIGWLATYLCSPFAGYLTGQTITVDGGEHQRRAIQAPEFVPISEQIAGNSPKP